MERKGALRGATLDLIESLLRAAEILLARLRIDRPSITLALVFEAKLDAVALSSKFETANVASVSSPFREAKATLTLKAGEWLRWDRFVMSASKSRRYLRLQEQRMPLIRTPRRMGPALTMRKNFPAAVLDPMTDGAATHISLHSITGRARTHLP